MVSRPHGGRLVNRVVRGPRLSHLLDEARELQQLEVSYERVIDILDIAFGVFSPLEGFLVQDDYESVLARMRLSNDIPWTIPVILDVDEEYTRRIKEGDEITLSYKGEPIAIMKIEDIYRWDRVVFCKKIFKTTDPNHPGVAKILKRSSVLIGGPLDLLSKPTHPLEHRILWPMETRVLFKEKKWRRIAAFQTRNVPHLGHEYVQKAALTFVDGLLIHPLLGWKKAGDYKDEVILEAYEVLIQNYYPKNSVVLAALLMNMNYAGPREAIHHAIVRKNFGATHIIIGRDHAGVGDYYKPYEAWELFREFPDIGITPLFIHEAFYCMKCKGMVTEKTCPHESKYRLKISGTKLRELIRSRQHPPEYFMRSEVASTILKYNNPFVEDTE